MVTGRVLKYDEVRGYGFAAPDSGGEDVFIHVNDLDFDKSQLTAGARINFEVEQGGRGLKAANIRLIDQVPAPEPAQVPGQSVPGQSPAPSQVQFPEPVAVPGPVPAMSLDDVVRPADGLCDVLSVRELNEEITEALLSSAPAITASDIVRIRQHFVKLAHGHGWIEP